MVHDEKETLNRVLQGVNNNIVQTIKQELNRTTTTKAMTIDDTFELVKVS